MNTMAATRTSQDVQPIGATEAAAIMGVHRANFTRDWAARPDFPPPIGQLSRGRVWDRAAVTQFARTQGPARGVATRRLPLSPDAARWLPTVKRRIVRRFQPLRLVLFGSQATGGARPDSDIDLLVVMPNETDAKETAMAIRRSLLGLPLSKDVIVTTPSQIERYGDVPGTMVYQALSSGATIYARP